MAVSCWYSWCSERGRIGRSRPSSRFHGGKLRTSKAAAPRHGTHAPPGLQKILFTRAIKLYNSILNVVYTTRNTHSLRVQKRDGMVALPGDSISPRKFLPKIAANRRKKDWSSTITPQSSRRDAYNLYACACVQESHTNRGRCDCPKFHNQATPDRQTGTVSCCCVCDLSQYVGEKFGSFPELYTTKHTRSRILFVVAPFAHAAGSNAAPRKKVARETPYQVA